MLIRFFYQSAQLFYQFFFLTEKLYLITEYCEGGDLRKVINYQRGRLENLFGTDIVLGWFTQLCLALQYIHKQKILHRDVTPSNIFLSSDGTIKLGDFGLAKVLQYQSRMMISGGENGLLYQAPEITMGWQPATTKCDMFAAGCVLYELLVGFQPFESPSLSRSLKNASRSAYKSLPSSHSDELRFLVDRLMSASAPDRPSADEVLQESFLKRFVSHFSPRDTGNSMSMRAEVTSSGQTVMEVLRSIRLAMSGNEDNFPLESEIIAPPNTPTTPVERSFPVPSKIFSSSAVPEKWDSMPCQWYDTGRRSSKMYPEEGYTKVVDNRGKIPGIRVDDKSFCPLQKLNKSPAEVHGESQLLKMKTCCNRLIAEDYQDAFKERPAYTS